MLNTNFLWLMLANAVLKVILGNGKSAVICCTNSEETKQEIELLLKNLKLDFALLEGANQHALNKYYKAQYVFELMSVNGLMQNQGYDAWYFMEFVSKLNYPLYSVRKDGAIHKAEDCLNMDYLIAECEDFKYLNDLVYKNKLLVIPEQEATCLFEDMQVWLAKSFNNFRKFLFAH